ncbi:MAG: DUF2341 domain-containing protein [Promethearchaeota archaeon]
MKFYRKRLKYKLKLFSILLFLLLIPIILNTPLFNLFHFEQLTKDENGFGPQETPYLSAPPNADDFSYYKTITIDHNKVAGSSTYPNFPVLISITDPDLKTDVQPDGDDIAFSVESVWVDHEIELFDQAFNSTHAQLMTWVRVPSLSGIIDTTIRMYYGNSTMSSRQNPQGVWENNYRGVWHLNEQSGGTDAIIDSTSYSNDGTDINSPNLGQTGQIYNSVGFIDASGQRIEVSDDSSLDISNQLTVEAWINPNANWKWMTIVSKMDGTWGSGNVAFFDIYVAVNDMGNFDIGLSNPSDNYNEWSSSVAVTTGTWQHFVFTYQSSTSIGRIFLNGASMSQHDYSLGTLGTNGNPFYIGFNRGWTGEVFDGNIDEVRISSIPRSSGWINTEYANQNDPDTFYTVGTEQVVSSEPSNAHYFTYYKTITIDHTQVIGSGSHINFPVLISIIDTDLKYHSQPDGDDIAFSMGGDWLNHEIELFDQSYSGTQAQLITWVNIPFLSTSTNTTITMYYGNSTMTSQENPSSVWNSNYVGIWHLNDNPGGTVYDSTSYNNDGYTTGSMSSSDLVSCKVGNGYELDGVDDMIIIPDSASLDSVNDEGTLSLWLNWVDPSAGRYQRVMTTSNRFELNPTPPPTYLQTEGFEWAVQPDGDNFFYPYGGNSINYNLATNPFTNSYWHYVVVTLKFSTRSVKIYLDGTSLVFSIENVPAQWSVLASPADWLWGGNNIISGSQFEGKFDEIRVSNVEKSANWISTEYNNQYDPSSFYSLGSEQLVSEQPSDIDTFKYYKVITIDHTKVNGTGSHLNFPLLISLLDSDLKYDVQNDGDDITFSMDGKWLDHQIEQFNQSYSGTHAQLITWVRIPFLSTAFDTEIRMYYGNSTISSRQNPGGVWYSGYSAVWHLNEDPSGTPLQIKDSTLPASDGATYGSMTSTDQVPGMIGGGLDFDGVNDYIDFGNPSELQLTGEFTVQAWFKVDYVGNDYLVVKSGGPGDRGWDISFDEGIAPNGWVMFRYSPDGVNTLTTGYEQVSINQWYHVAGVFKPNEYSKFFLNGTQLDIITTGVPPSRYDPSLPVRIARRSDASTSYVNGIMDEVRISTVALSNDWIASEYANQYDPSSFYSVGPEQSLIVLPYLDVQINAIDLYGNLIPNVTISIYQFTQLIDRGITNTSGSILFSNIIEGYYNFSASIYSDLANVTKIVNITSEPISLNQTYQIINLICDVTSHFFEVIDIDTDPLESGWIMVGNDTQILKRCNIDPTGHTTFWWVDAPLSEYNYTVYYSDSLYNPSTLTLATGDITTENETIQIQVELTTVNITVNTISPPITPVSGAKLKLTVDNPFGASIVNLTTDLNGQATLRWLNSSGIGGDYCIQIEFFGVNRLFIETLVGPPLIYNFTFTVANKESHEFRMSIDLSKFQTELISLNPTDYFEIEWGTVLKLRSLFNVSKVETGYEFLLGPEYADIMTYEMLLGGLSVRSGEFTREIGNEGRHFVDIDTTELDSDASYVIIISAQKSGYSLPSDLILQLDILETEVELNQSDNDESATSVYWSDNADMTLKSYGVNTEALTIENTLFHNINHEFSFLISDVQNNWNLSRVIFNIYGISWNVGVSNISISIEDPYGTSHLFNSTNHLGWDYNRSTWTGITLDLNKASKTNDNNFNFKINGTFDGTVDITMDAYCIRDSFNVQYSKLNNSDFFSLLSKSEGWAIKNIIIELRNCFYTSNWSTVDLSSLSNLNITTNEGFTYSLDTGYTNGTGFLTINDRMLYPIENQFLFTVKSNSDIIFDTIINVEYVQEFFINQIFETYNFTVSQQGIANGATVQLSAIENSWIEEESILWITGIKSGSTYLYPSDVTMSITIGGQTYSISDYGLGVGKVILDGLTKNQLLQADIDTSSAVNFSLLHSIKYLREISYEIISSLSYQIVEEPSISGMVQYNTQLQYYLKTIDTSILDADEYTVRFTISKEHYVSTTKNLNLLVLNRPTMLNGSTEFFRKIESIYIKDAVNFTLYYTDAITGAKVTNLKTQYYIWESYDQEGNVNETGQGNIFSTINNTYIVDFNTDIRSVGEFLLIVILDKENYDYKNAMILLSIIRRDFNYALSENLQDKQTNVVQGRIVPIELTLTDPTRGDIPVINATIELIIGVNSYEFEYVNGTYTLDFPTNNIDAFFTSTTLRGLIKISKQDYNSIEVSITIVVEMQEIFPGIPMFYFLLIASAIGALVGSIVGYRVYQNAKIPSFVKKVRAIKKAIKGDKSISDSLIYRDKEVFVGETIKNNWDKLGLSIEEVFGISVEREKKGTITKKRLTEITRVHDNKPLGLILMKWDERIGTEIIVNYPAEIKISEKTLMQIYSTHEYSGEKGVITLTAEAANIISYYSGPEEGYYLLLILNLDDDPDVYEGGLAETLRILLENIADESYVRLLPSLFQRISLYPSLSHEEVLAVTYQNKIKRSIINLLKDEGVVIKSELIIWLKDKFVYGFFDLETILSELIKLDILKVSSIKDVPSELIFLTNDIFLVRVPPLKLLDKPTSYGLPPQFAKDYPNDVKYFFQTYLPTEEDNIKIAEILSNPQVYETLRLLRDAIVTREDLEKLRKKGVDDVYGVLKILWDNKLIKVYHDDKNIEYYALISDPYIDFIFPKYLLKMVKSAYETKSKVKKSLIEYLNILEETYYNLKSSKK